MRLDGGSYDCDVCGAVLDLPPGSLPYPMMVATSEGPKVRVLWMGGEEVHRCEIPDSAEPASGASEPHDSD
jgi:hypothetical protein